MYEILSLKRLLENMSKGAFEEFLALIEISTLSYKCNFFQNSIYLALNRF
jgi:hypothetical protein